jgi:hypothetical protein
MYFKGNDIVPYVMRKCGKRVESGEHRARFWLEKFIEKIILQ